MTIAGSDSGACAGIQADLKTFSALGVHGCSVITALTAQNTRGVQGILNIDPEFVKEQLDSVFSDFSIKAVKVGMLSQPEVISTVAQALEKYKPGYVVIDPVIVAGVGGHHLLQESAIETLKTELFPKASLITPNLHEAAKLLNCSVPENEEEMKDMIERLLNLGCSRVFLKGEHLKSKKPVDFYYDGKNLYHLRYNWVNTIDNTIGAGCTFSSAITALLAWGYTMNEAIYEAKNYISGAIFHADELSCKSDGQPKGPGPVNQLFKLL